MTDVVGVFGDQMFGRRIRLRLLLWVNDQDAPFNQSQAARGIAYGSSGEVAKELARLVKLGMVRKLRRVSKVGPQNYRRLDHPAWAIVDTASEVMDGLSDVANLSSARRSRDDAELKPVAEMVGTK